MTPSNGIKRPVSLSARERDLTRTRPYTGLLYPRKGPGAPLLLPNLALERIRPGSQVCMDDSERVRLTVRTPG